MKNKTAILGLTVWILGSTFFLTEYFVRVSTGVLSTYLFHDFHTNATAIGLLSGYFYYTYISMQIPVGILVDRFGARWLLSVAAILFGCACILFSEMNSLETGYFARAVMGFVGAFAFVGTLKLITIYFPANKFAILSGITQGSGMVGAIIGAAPMAYLFNHIGWRLSFLSFGILFVALGISMAILIRDKLGNVALEVNQVKSYIIEDLKIVLISKQTWLNCLFICLLYGPTEVFGEQLGIMFRSISSGISIQLAALQVSFIFLGLAVGCPLLGYISDYIQSRVKVMRFSSISCFILIMFMIYSEHLFNMHINYYIMCFLMFLYGVFNSAIIPSYAISTEIHKRSVSGMALGVTNMATVAGGSFFIPLIGHIIDILSAERTSNIINNANYNIKDFEIGFTILPVCFLICFMLTYLIKETGCKVVVE